VHFGGLNDTGQQISKSFFYICNEYVINLFFASMKLEKGQKNYLAPIIKLCYHHDILRNRLKYYTERCLK